MTELQYLIVFSRPCDTNETANYIGFRFFTKAEADQYMKCLKALAEEDCAFDFEDLHFTYVLEDFSKIKVGQAEAKVLQKIFGADVKELSFGIFPDAMNDAVDFNVFDEYAEDEEAELEDDEEY